MTGQDSRDAPLKVMLKDPDAPQDGNNCTLLEGASTTDTLEPIAIIGLDLKFPQDAVSSDAFWRLMNERRSALTEIPKDRFNVDAFYHPDTERASTLNIKGGHFIRENIAAFDAPFFSISPAEASCMDPQQRGLLECAYRALENAGVTLSEVAGSRTSVHVGSFSREYETILLRDPEMQAKYMATGTGTAMLANRLSWYFDLRGPSIAIDTACSSSLLALHVACQSLRSGESTMGLVAGCNLLYNPDLMIPMTNLNFLSADSKCYSFDHRANGYSRGEGFGTVVVKPLFKAIQDGNTIRAVIRATGTNQDGRTPGITQPSSLAQERLIRATYQAGGIGLDHTRFFEAHGTGTPVGDPLEASAIGAVFGSQRSTGDPLYVGAVKSNIGHLEGASGIAGLVKSILVLEKGTIPPNTWFERPNPKIRSDEWNLKFPVQSTPWPSSGLRRASVNSFGFGGSNVHVVLDDAYHYLTLRDLVGIHHTVVKPPDSEELLALDKHPQTCSPMKCASAKQPNLHHKTSMSRLLVWSASDEDGLSRLNSLYRRYLAEHPQNTSEAENFENLVYTLCTKHSSLNWKSFAVADSTIDLERCLENALSKPARSNHVPRLAFVFTGQGAHWCGMGKELLIYPVFLQSLRKAGKLFRSLGCEWDVMDELDRDQEAFKMNNPAFSQPICTALQVALVDLLHSWKIHPSAVVGHSSGEIAAAYCTGSLSQESAWRVAYHRGIVCGQIALRGRSSGAMLSVDLSEVKVQSFLAKLGAGNSTRSVTVGCVNSPDNVTLTGDEAQIDFLKMTLDQHQIYTRKLDISVAYHSSYMEEVALEYEESLQDIASESFHPNSPAVSMFSTISGEMVYPEHLQKSEYWARNLTSPVQFVDAVTSMLYQSSSIHGNGCDGSGNELGMVDHLIEIGPHSALQRPVKDILKRVGMSETIGYSSLLSRGICALKTSLTTAGRLHCLGYHVDLTEVNRFDGRRIPRMLIDLPGYPFDHSQTYWLESRISKNFRFRQNPPHELLGTTVRDWDPSEPRWRHFIRESDNPWILHHKVNGVILYPASAMLVMAIEAIRQLYGSDNSIKGYKLKGVEFLKAIEIVQGQDDPELTLCLRPHRNNEKGLIWHEFCLRTYTCDTWVESCRGHIRAEYQSQDEVDGGRQDRENKFASRRNYLHGRARCKTPVTASDLYERLSEYGYGFGLCFQTLNEVYCNDDGEATCLIRTQDWSTKIPSNSVSRHVIHPTTLDGILQSIFPGLSMGGRNRIPTLVPTGIQDMWVSNVLLQRTGNIDIKVYSKSESQGLRVAESAIVALDVNDSEPQVLIKGIQTTAVANNTPSPSEDLGSKRVCYNLESQPDLDLLTNEQVFEFCSKSLKMPAIDRDNEAEDMELTCFLSISTTLHSISNEMLPSSKPHLNKYLAWMKYQLERYDNGLLACGRSEWRKQISNLEYQNTLFERVKGSNPEGKLCYAVAKNLAPLLTGKLDALQFFFGDTLMDQYYQWSLEQDNSFAKIAAYLNAYVHKDPNLNILEIGAGTGSGTESIMKVLTRHGEDEEGAARYRHFTFTDISPSFFEKAREKFATQTDRMTYKVLDITSDPEQQGFQLGSYDLILAVNVLHATPNLDVTLQNTRKLMKPGAKLVLVEICNLALLRTGFIFGLLPGWWLGTEANRVWGPLLSEQDWHSVLARNGFSGTDVVLRGNESERMHQGSVILSTATEQVIDRMPFAPQEILIFAMEGSLLQHSIAGQLRAQLLSLGFSRCDVIDPQDISRTPVAKRYCISLLELEGPILTHMEASQFTHLQKVVTSAKALFWITKGGEKLSEDPGLGLVSGLSRCIRSEYSDLNFVTLALENFGRDPPSLVQQILKVFETTMHADQGSTDKEYVEINGVICINRIVEANYLNQSLFPKKVSLNAEARQLKADPTRPLRLSIASPGLLNTLQFVTDVRHNQDLRSGEVEVDVKATGLNFQDLAVLLDQVSSDQIGLECAGIVTKVGYCVESNLKIGDRVCCISRGSSYVTYARTKTTLVAKLPDSVPFVSAAAIPMAYCTAYYSLYDLGRLQEDTSILIHCGAGGVGQAAIQLAKLVTETSNIFVTVGSLAKKRLLIDRYGISEDHVFSSRGLTFADGVRRMTQDRGVDLVLNSLGGEKLRQSLGCVAPYGRFIDIGLKDVTSSGTLPLLPFSKSITFSSVDLDLMIQNAPETLGGILRKVMELLRSQKITPEASHIFNYSKLEEAFRLLQRGNNLGKVVAVPHDTDMVPVIPDDRVSHFFDPMSTYLISGGLGGLGRSITRWMAARGAKNFILLGRSGACSEPSLSLLAEMKAMNINIKAPACDISDGESLKSALAECKGLLPPIKGCIQAAMFLKVNPQRIVDGIFENLKLDDFKAVLRPKVQGSWNLHAQLPKGMDFFIFLSSLNGVLGSRSQASYGAGNTYEDALAKYRVNQGEKAVSLDIGLVNTVGYVAERPEVKNSQLLTGLAGIEESQLHAVLEYHCNPALPLSSPLRSQVLIGIETPAALQLKCLEEPYWLNQPICRNLFQMNDGASSATSHVKEQIDHKIQLRSAQSLGAAKDIVCKALKAKLSKLLSLPVVDIDGYGTISSYGTDSLVAVELKNWLFKEMAAEFAILEILSNISLSSFSEMAARRSTFATFVDGDKAVKE